MLLCDAAKIWALQVNYGIPLLLESSKQNTVLKYGLNMPSKRQSRSLRLCVEALLMIRRKLFRKKDAAKFDYPYKETGLV